MKKSAFQKGNWMNNFWENKKVAAYIALKHHTRFIIPIMEKIAGQGAKTIYLVAQAERSQEITAVESGLDYCHIFDFITEKDRKTIQATYQNLKNGFAKAFLEDTVFSIQAPTVLDKTLYATAQEYTGFKNFMEQFKPDLCIALHEVNRWGKIFSFHAKLQDIPCITLQEGLLSPATSEHHFETTGHVQHSTLDLVWGEESKKFLSTYEAPEDRIVPAGNTHLTSEIDRLKKENIRRKKRKEYKCTDLFVACLFFSAAPPEVNELKPLFTAFNQKTDKKLFIKFHPATSRPNIDNWISRLAEKEKKFINFIHAEENTYNLIAMSDLVVLSEGSTIALEALAIGKPVAVLTFESYVKFRSSLPEKKAALAYSPGKLAEAIENNTDFHSMMDPKGVSDYIAQELTDPDNSIENTVQIMASCINANKAPDPKPLFPEFTPEKHWSILLPVVDRPEVFLSILENISANSEGHDFEVILIKPENLSEKTEYILDTLEGDISSVLFSQEKTFPEILNQAAVKSHGRFLCIFNPFLAPAEGWLESLEEGIAQYGAEKIFGGRVINTYNNIVHAGMVLNANNSPVSAYLHLDKNFPPANKTRDFQMVDHFIGIDRNLFLSSGGFDKRAGKYAFMDFGLRIKEQQRDPELVIYLPKVLLTSFDNGKYQTDDSASIFFYSRWHGVLWESEDMFYKNDGVSPLQLEAARMTRAMGSVASDRH